MDQNKVAWPDANEIRCKYLTGIAVGINELMFLSDGSISTVTTGYAAPVTSLTDSSTLTTNQSRLAGAFLGLAHERKVTTDATGTILIARSACRQVACNALQSAAKPGDMVAGSVLTATGGTALTSLIVEVTSTASYAIGYVVEDAAAGATTLKVLFVSNKVCGTIPNANQSINTAANLTLTGNESIGGNLAVTGTSTFTGDLAETGNVAITGTLGVTGNVTTVNTACSGTLGVTGVSTMGVVNSSGLHSMKAGALSAAGTVIGNAAAIVAQATAVTGAANAGVKLPAITANLTPPLLIAGDPTNAIKVYPPTNASIDAGGANAAVSLAAGEHRIFFSDGNASYFSVKSA
jgi:hypothetical protein